MSEFMGPSPSWYDPPEGHKPECICDQCHALHVENGTVEENATSPDLTCCQDEMDAWIIDGQWCLQHGGAYMQTGECNECKIAESMRLMAM